MADYLQQVEIEDEIRQGDVFLYQEDAGKNKGWAVLLTKDCDIVQKKFGSHFTYLPITTLSDYFRYQYAPVELEKFKKECFKNTEQLIASAKSDSGLDNLQLSFETLADWINEEGIDNILDSLELKPKLKLDLSKVLESIEVIISWESDATLCNWECLIDVLSALGRKSGKMKNELVGHVKKGMGDAFFFVPTLPGENETGFVVNLRDIRSMDCNYVYRSLHDARKSMGSFPRLIRRGRFKDYLRFSLAQNAALLFSRIGMRSHFEADATVAIDMVADELIEGLVI